MAELEQTSINNGFIYSLFASKPHKTSSSISPEALKAEVYQAIYTFTLSKATLKSIARELLSSVDILFAELDENQHGWLDETDLKLILEASGLRAKQKDLSLLMVHFGKEEKITLNSMKQVLQIQKNS